MSMTAKHLKQNAQFSVTEWENEIKQLVENHRIMEPKVSVKNDATGVGLTENYQWLKKNALQFKGLWVALSRGVLIDSHDNLTTLRQTLEKSGKLTHDVAFMAIEN